jgi:hypothetical protein
MPYFVIEKQYIIIYIIINLWRAVRIGIACNIRLVIITAVEQAGYIGIRYAVGLVVYRRKTFIMS